ncbi:DUF3251 domain-containing protein [Bordetella petrii]|uniref:Lipoprotein n=1 Tax=Bordetella petrii (strain ATCC BAA-461 / DSM 12804 / CCUG 43448 / CIP 107267 / Se-1111R) TaxID=340100 RepID=A9I497_BORPD|nr:DUF3251 domain-containing protein [Bordetella petrii]CAP40967.1 putative lipoprotein [Bordetella petrii]
MRISYLFVLAILFLSGCRLDTKTAEEVAQLKQHITQQDSAIQELKRSSEALKAELASVKLDTSFNSLRLNLESASYTAPLNLTDQSFSTVRTGLGIFLVSVQDVTPFANGVKLKLDVGNPQAMTYAGLKFKLSWKTASNANGPDQTKDIDLPQRFLPGSWNRAELVISPAKADDIANVRVSIDPNQVRLQVPASKG